MSATEYTDPVADMMHRLRPAKEAVEAAHAALDAELCADMAAIPMVLPGKEFGIWQVGQPVETVEGLVFLGVRSCVGETAEGPVQPWSQARNAASEAAQAARGDRPGTVAYAVVYRDGQVGVIEDVF